jgi:amidohydrolase
VLTLPATAGGEPEPASPLDPGYALTCPDPRPALDRFLASRGAHLIAVRRHIHAHPELSGQEFETAALIQRELTEAGLAPRLLPAGNGVICDIGTGDGPVVALRADIDALPLPDTKDVPYRSTKPNVCHACGHDAHATILIGVGQVLARMARDGELPGRVRLLFQPAEEQIMVREDGLLTGAPEIIAAGGLKDVGRIYALHCNPQLPVGTVGVRSGAFTAAADTVEVRITGPGGHTARPHLTVDLVHSLGRVLVDVPALLDRRVDVRGGVSLVFGAVRSGEAANTIPSEGWARGTVRTLSRDTWRELPSLVSELVQSVVAGTGGRAHVTYTRGVPPVVNDRESTELITAAATAALGAQAIREAEVSMGGEDFAYYLETVPGAMVRLGVGRPGAAGSLDIHQSSFDIDEAAIGHGVRLMVHAALMALTHG